MTILNIAKILMNMKSSWFSDLKLHIVIDHEPRVFKHFKSNFQPRPGRWHRQVPQEGHQEDVQEEDSEEVQGQAFPEGMCHRNLTSESDDT